MYISHKKFTRFSLHGVFQEYNQRVNEGEILICCFSVLLVFFIMLHNKTILLCIDTYSYLHT
jgi:hypothetical protein